MSAVEDVIALYGFTDEERDLALARVRLFREIALLIPPDRQSDYVECVASLFTLDVRELTLRGQHDNAALLEAHDSGVALVQALHDEDINIGYAMAARQFHEMYGLDIPAWLLALEARLDAVMAVRRANLEAARAALAGGREFPTVH